MRGVDRSQGARLLSTALFVVGITLHLALGYLYVISGLVVPTPFLFALWAAWGALLVVAFQLRDKPVWVLAAPVVGALLWVGVVLGLGTLLNWQA